LRRKKFALKRDFFVKFLTRRHKINNKAEVKSRIPTLFKNVLMNDLQFLKSLHLNVNILYVYTADYLKELSHEIEMGCWWDGRIEPYLEMNL
jgi:hypothetical protein